MKPKMPRAIAVSAAVVLSALALLHVVWTRSPWPLSTRQEFLETLIGSEDVGRHPTLAMTLVVAGLLLAAAWVLLARVALLPWWLPVWMLRWGPHVIASVLLLRGVGGLIASGLLHLSTRAFEYWDIRLYSPLSLALGAAAVLVGIHPVLLPMYRRQEG